MVGGLDIVLFPKRARLCNWRSLSALLCVATTCLFLPKSFAGSVKATVNVIIDKLPLDKEQKMQDFDRYVKEYIESVEWLEEDDRVPVSISLQLFLTESVTNVEDRYNCEFLISSSDVQYFDKRVRFPFNPGDRLVYNAQSVDPLTGVINFYVNMVLGSELDKYQGFGGDIYYKRALNFAALGKFVRTQFITGWTEREERVKKIFMEPFTTFRRMKDFYFYGIYVLEQDKNRDEARRNILAAIDLIEQAVESKDATGEFEEPKQFLDAHYAEIVDLLKDYGQRNTVLKKLMKLDPDHKDTYEKYLTDS